MGMAAPSWWTHWVTRQVADALHALHVTGERTIGFGWADAQQLIEELQRRRIQLVESDNEEGETYDRN